MNLVALASELSMPERAVVTWSLLFFLMGVQVCTVIFHHYANKRAISKAAKANARAVELVDLMREDHKRVILSADQGQSLIKMQRDLIERLQSDNRQLLTELGRAPPLSTTNIDMGTQPTDLPQLPMAQRIPFPLEEAAETR